MDRQGVHNSYGSTAKDAIDEQRMVLSMPQLSIQRKSVTSMKLFTMVVLHSWRQRRKEVRELKEMVQHLQDSVSIDGFNNLFIRIIRIGLCYSPLSSSP